MLLNLLLFVLISALIASILSKFFRLNFRLKGVGLCERVRFFLLYPLLAFFIKRIRKRKSFNQDFSDYWKAVLPEQKEWDTEKPNSKSSEDGVELLGVDNEGNFVALRIANCADHLESRIEIGFRSKHYSSPESILPKGDGLKFAGNGLSLELREAFRSWRFTFRGYLREKESQQLVFIKFEGWWKHISDPLHARTMTSAVSAAKILAANKQSARELFSRLMKGNELHQWGEIKANVHIASTKEELNLRGLRTRFTSSKCPKKESSYCKEFSTYFNDGTFLYLCQTEMDSFESTLDYGYIHLPRGEFYPIHSVSSLDIQPNAGYLNVRANGLNYLLRLKNTEYSQAVLENPFKKQKTERVVVNVELNGRKTLGFLSTSTRYFPHGPAPQLHSDAVHFNTDVKSDRFVIPLTHIACQNSELTGGKGANLAKLHLLQDTFVVPSGFCVTSSAYNHHIKTTEGLEKGIKSVNSDPENIRKLLIQSQLSPDLLSEVEEGLRREFGERWESVNVAVRSSAIGEDSDQLSAAGQLQTYLGVRGLENIATAIVQCWASNFSSEVLSYRRQHGQELSPPAAVVIQKMIDPDYAGVLFSQDPISGDNLQMILNANPGVGESVVSGLVTPDTVYIRKEYGSKNLSISEKTPVKDEVCISDEVSLKLGRIGIELERSFGAPQDIEWAFKDGELFILQSRPITSLEMESDWELLHEFDSGTIADDEWFTTANLGEVLPEAVAPLSISITTQILERIIQVQLGMNMGLKHINKHRLRMFYCYRNRMLFSITESMMRSLAHMPDSQVMEVSFFGHVLEEAKVKEVCKQKYPAPTSLEMARNIYNISKVLFFDRQCYMRDSIAKFSNFQLPESSDPAENLRIIEDHIKDYCDVTLNHTLTSAGTSATYASAEIIRGRNKTALTPEILSDIATLYASCQEGIISADVPNSLKRIAQKIFQSDQAKLFGGLNEADSVDWLRNLAPEAVRTEFANFLRLHGHRCPQEFDFARVPWGDDPTQIIPAIKSQLNDSAALFAEKKEISPEEAIAKIKTPLGRIAKYLLKLMIPIARFSVAARETTKNLDVFVTNVFRKKYLEIGQQLKERGYLPDAELIFYMSHHEIPQILNTRSPRIIARALRRRKLLPLQNKLVYPELNEGHPHPTEKGLRKDLTPLKTLKGTAVCLGVVEGVARVAHDLSEAQHTQPGEILITKSTDIGWSPFFPIIGGLVTELGGLVSHGAVVAREYGLPCLIGVADATHHFTTGDKVVLDAEKGLISKVESF